jgi:hypothetical protein
MYFVQATADDDENTIEATQQQLQNEDGCLMVVMMSLLFALCISFCGSMLGYVSFLDDNLLKRYQEEASVVRADVCSADCVRTVGDGCSGCSDRGTDQREYCATIEYNQIISECYPIRVRKQIRALESDFVDADSSPQENDDDEKSFFKTSFLEGKKLDLFVLGGKPMSGFPQKLLERRLSFLYRISSICAIVSTLCLAAFCIYIAVRAMDDAKDQKETTVAKVAIWIFGMLIALEIPITHTFLHEPITQALEDEYFESADLTPTGYEESSLSSCSTATPVVKLYITQ